MLQLKVKENKVKRALAKGERVYGVWVSIPSPVPVEIAGYAGLDYVILDNEHGAYNDETLENMIRAAENVDIAVLVRVVENRESAILKVLDRGADGIIVPHISAQKDAQAAVRAARYPPEGNRGQMVKGRCAAYGAINPREYLTSINKEVMVIALIEDSEGVKNIQEIASTPGVDGVAFGPGDFALSTGLGEQRNHPDVLAARDKVWVAAQNAGILFDGVHLNTIGADSQTLLEVWKATLQSAKPNSS